MCKTENQNKTKNTDKKKITAFQLFASELNSESAVKEKERERERCWESWEKMLHT